MSRTHRVLRVAGQRIAWTNTSHIPDVDLVAAIRFTAQHIDLDRTIVHAKHAGRYRRSGGMAYDHIPGETNTDGLRRHEWRYLITVTDYTWHDFGDQLEALLFILGHEAKHIEQYRELKTRSWERPANAFGHWLVRKWKEAA